MTETATERRRLGRILRDQALDLAKQFKASYVRRACRIMLERALANEGRITTDFVRDSMSIREGIGWRWLGAVPKQLAKAGLLTAGGYEQSSIIRNHARPVGVWYLTDRHRARLWLAENPELPDPPEPPAE